LSILLGIPSILIDNNVGKLSKYRNTWTQTCKLTKVALSAEEAKSMAESFFASGRTVQRKTLPFEPVVADSSADDEEKRMA
jgi:exopolysaccharide biosynthesis predicted pyruvyltransferase EpsI